MPTPLSLSQLADRLQLAIESATAPCWVQAEIASLSSRSGHLYLDLVEKGQKGILAAKMRATCWANVAGMLSLYFEQETGMPLQVGLQILVEVEPTFHAVYGLSLNILNINPLFTIGDMARQRQQTIEQLQQEGVWDMQRDLLLPTLLRRIAVISSDSAAGYQDFCQQLDQTYRISTSLFAATMQGDQAEQSILQALQQIAEQPEQWDAVVILRGGGATTDLGCFDRYLLCAVCAQFPIPIITGIGHTRDVSILDQIAHLSLKTPTAVADFLVSRMQQQAELIEQLSTRLARTADRQILVRQHAIELLFQRLEACSPERIYQRGYSLLLHDGKPVRSITELHSGDRIQTCLQDGQITSIVQ